MDMDAGGPSADPAPNQQPYERAAPASPHTTRGQSPVIGGQLNPGGNVEQHHIVSEPHYLDPRRKPFSPKTQRRLTGVLGEVVTTDGGEIRCGQFTTHLVSICRPGRRNPNRGHPVGQRRHLGLSCRLDNNSVTFDAPGGNRLLEVYTMSRPPR